MVEATQFKKKVYLPISKIGFLMLSVRQILKSPLATAICLNVFFFAFYLLIGKCYYSSLDDYFMSAVLTGAYGSKYDVHLYFTNVAYAYLLKPFYWLLPTVGWYYLFQCFCTFCAFSTFCYFIIKKLSIKLGLLFSVLLLACALPEFFSSVAFTQCAAAASAAGIMLIVSGFVEQRKLYYVFGVMFIALGFIFRKEMFLLSLPCLGFSLLVCLLQGKRICKSFVTALVTSIAILFGLYELDKSEYQDPDYKYYAAYQGPRAVFGDGAYYDSDAVFDELEEQGKIGYDYRALASWVYYDTEVFSLDSLMPIIDVVKRNLYQPNYVKMPMAILFAMSKSVTRPILWAWALFGLALVLFAKNKLKYLPWITVCFMCIAFGYLLWVNRLAAHVESGIWLYSITFMVPWLDNFEVSKEKSLKIIKLFSCLAIVIALIFITMQKLSERPLNQILYTPTLPVEWRLFETYASEHPDDVFLLVFDKYKDLATDRNVPYKSTQPGSWQNIFPMGYWNVHLPAMKYELEKRGVKNPLRDILNDNVYVIENDKGFSPGFFYQQHYKKSIVADTVVSFDYLKVLKYRLLENEK